MEDLKAAQLQHVFRTPVLTLLINVVCYYYYYYTEQAAQLIMLKGLNPNSTQFK